MMTVQPEVKSVPSQDEGLPLSNSMGLPELHDPELPPVFQVSNFPLIFFPPSDHNIIFIRYDVFKEFFVT
jgi:hypothetical protein